MDSFIGNFTAGFSVLPQAIFPGSDMATILPYATGLVGGKKKSSKKKSSKKRASKKRTSKKRASKKRTSKKRVSKKKFSKKR